VGFEEWLIEFRSHHLYDADMLGGASLTQSKLQNLDINRTSSRIVPAPFSGSSMKPGHLFFALATLIHSEDQLNSGSTTFGFDFGLSYLFTIQEPWVYTTSDDALGRQSCISEDIKIWSAPLLSYWTARTPTRVVSRNASMLESTVHE